MVHDRVLRRENSKWAQETRQIRRWVADVGARSAVRGAWRSADNTNVTSGLAAGQQATVFGDIEPKRPHHYRRQYWIGTALRKKMLGGASVI